MLSDPACYPAVSRRWGDKTQEDYWKDYEKYILPDLDHIPLAALTREDFEAVLERLPERKKAEGRVCNARTIRHITVLILYVLQTADEKGICPNVWWGSVHCYADTKDEEELTEKELVRLRKSLTAHEEVRIAERILQDPMQSGTNMGLAIMYCAGTRNGEACGDDYGDIRPMDCDADQYCLWQYKVEEDGLQRYGGKSENAVRVIPIPAVLKALILARRENLIDMVISGDILVEGAAHPLERAEAARIVDRLPIACEDGDYTKRCNSNKLSAAGTALLRKVQVEQDLLGLIDRDIRRPGRTEEGIREKDPTAYLLRRNLGTHLYVLGLDDSEIQYIMGHELEDIQDRRNDYRNEELLLPIALKMARRPIVNSADSTPESQIKEDSYSKCGIHKEKFILHVTGSVRLRIRLRQREFGSRPRIVVTHRGLAQIRGIHTQSSNHRQQSDKLVEMRQYHKVFRAARKKLLDEDRQTANSDIVETNDTRYE